MNFTKSFEVYPFILLNDFFRYFIVAGIAYLIFWIIFKKHWQHRIIQKKMPKSQKMLWEFGYSMSTVVIFSIIGWLIVTLERAGHTQIYHDITERGWLWFTISVVLMILLHDAYFYWTHRLMHHPKIYRYIHAVHHHSTNPSPWAAYSFHPLEALIEAVVFLIIVFSIPTHGLALFIFLVWMIVRNVLGHLGIEFLPNWFIRNKWLNWVTSTTHHDLHHKNFHSNYGLYFTWWDKWFSTEDKHYKSTFNEITKRPKGNPKSKIAKKISKAAIVCLFMLSYDVRAQSPVGIWQTFHEESGKPLSLIEIEQTSAGLEGRIIKIYLQPWEGEDPICVKCSGDLKNQKVIGMNFIWDFALDGKNGKILDPASGNIYHSKMWLNDPRILKVRGYAGLANMFYRTQTWKLKQEDNDNNPFTGIWQTIDDETGNIKSLVKIYQHEGKLAGKILKIYLQPWEGENPICLKCPGEKKNAKIVGMSMLWGFTKKENSWGKGKIMDPGNGATYNSEMWLADNNTLHVRGYWGIFYRTQTWKRFEQ